MRKGMMKQMMSEGNGYSKIEYSVPTRGLMGYRSEFINDTMVGYHGDAGGIWNLKGEIQSALTVLLAQEEGNRTQYLTFRSVCRWTWNSRYEGKDSRYETLEAIW